MSLPLTTKEVPFFKLLIPLLGGILIEHYFPIIGDQIPIFITLILCALLFSASYFISATWSYRWIFGASLYPLLFALGMAFTTPQKVKLISEKPVRVIARLIDDPSQRERSYRATIEVLLINKSSTWERSTGKVLAYFKLEDTCVAKLGYGSLIGTEIKPTEIPKPKNPKQFDYHSYLSNKGILLSTTIQPNHWKLLGYKGNMVKSKANKLSKKLIALFRSSGLKDDELAVASALTIGYKELLDDELKKVYSDSGTMHILAVSGMHVAILYYFLSFMLIFLNKNKTARLIKAIILVVFLWFFAIITGLSPSVQRAALMFSFIVVGDSLNRKISVYNSLAASAFILLLLNPNSFFDTGFQLSYIAVLSIVFFYPLISKLLTPKNLVISYLWSLLAVSVAAQVGTFGLSIFYFNQFPNLFLLSNLIAIPISTVAMYLSIILIIVSPIPILATVIGKLFSLSLWLLNSSLKIVEEIPGSVTNGLFIDGFQLVLLLTIITFIAIYIVKKQNVLLFTLLSLVTLFQISMFIHRLENLRKKQLVVFNIPNGSIITLKDGIRMTIYTDDSTDFRPETKYGFYLKPYLCATGNIGKYDLVQPKIETQRNKYNIKTDPELFFCTFKGKSIAYIYGKRLEKMRSAGVFKLDILIINRLYPKNIFSLFEPKRIIVASNIERWKLDKLRAECAQRGVEFYNVPEQGAFILNQ